MPYLPPRIRKKRTVDSLSFLNNVMSHVACECEDSFTLDASLRLLESCRTLVMPTKTARYFADHYRNAAVRRQAERNFIQNRTQE